MGVKHCFPQDALLGGAISGAALRVVGPSTQDLGARPNPGRRRENHGHRPQPVHTARPLLVRNSFLYSPVHTNRRGDGERFSQKKMEEEAKGEY